MELDEALYILQLTDCRYSEITIKTLKKQYHRLALQNHPDKNNNSEESTKRFQDITDAYEIITKLVDLSVDGNDNDTFKSFQDMGYTSFLQIFIENMIDGNYNIFIANIIKEIVNGCKDISVKLFEGINKDHAMIVYNFIVKYKQTLHISEETLDNVRNIILTKFNNIQIFELNPCINDLLDHNVYKLEVNGKIYYCPLWHSELYFDDIEDGQSDLIVRCNPELLENIVIDENNNLLVTENIDFSSLLHRPFIDIHIGNQTFVIPTHELTIQKEQYYRFRKRGISCINETDMYNIEKKGDIIVKVIFG